MTDTRTRPVVRHTGRLLTPAVASVLAVLGGLTFLFLAAYFAAGGPLGPAVATVLIGAAAVAAVVTAALIFHLRP